MPSSWLPPDAGGGTKSKVQKGAERLTFVAHGMTTGCLRMGALEMNVMLILFNTDETN